MFVFLFHSLIYHIATEVDQSVSFWHIKLVSKVATPVGECLFHSSETSQRACDGN